jgi:hypothetical protein
MRPKPGARPLAITAEETLAPGIGFAWLATARVGPFTMRVLDAYHHDEGFMMGRFLGVIPLMNASGDDVTRSSRGRLAAESVFVPPALLAGPGIRWEPIDDERALAVHEIDGEVLPVTIRVDGEGALVEITMERHGDVGGSGWSPTPYGFSVEQEGAFEGVRMPSILRGGWWYGTDGYDPEQASMFEILDARFR